MPLRIQTREPLRTPSFLPLPLELFATLSSAAYEPMHAGVGYSLAYYLSAEAKQSGAFPLDCNQLTTGFYLATPGPLVPMPGADYWEGLAAEQLRELLGPDATVEYVP